MVRWLVAIWLASCSLSIWYVTWRMLIDLWVNCPLGAACGAFIGLVAGVLVFALAFEVAFDQNGMSSSSDDDGPSVG